MPYTIAKHKEITAKTYNGEITIDEFKSAFYEAIDSKDSLKTEYSAMTKDQLLSNMNPMGRYRYKSEKKDRIVNALVGDIPMFFMLGAFSYMMGQDTDALMKAKVDKLTQSDLDKYAEEIAEQRKEYSESRKALQKAVQNPETLEEFKQFIQYKGKDKLTPEQLKVYDELIAFNTKDKQQSSIEQKGIVSQVKGIEGIELSITETKHTKTGEDLFVVKLSERVDKEVYNELNRKAKQLSGWYSSYNKSGAIPGFQFKERSQAEKFIGLKEGNVSNIDKIEERQEIKEEKRVNRLRDNANSIIQKVDAELSKERLVNTSRRASMASSIENRLQGDKAIAETMLKIADAIDTGETKFLDKISTRTQVEQLNSIVQRAHYNYIRSKYGDYGNEYENHRYDPIVEEIAMYIPESNMFWPSIYGRNLKDVLEQYSSYPGLKLVSERIKKKIPKGEDSSYQVSSNQEMEDVLDFANKMPPSYKSAWIKEIALEHKRLTSMGIESDEMLRAVVREFIQYREGKKEVDKVKELTRKLAGRKVGIDHFPTPLTLSEQMAEMANIQEGMSILEPSAGEGNIADAIKKVSGISPDVIEISSELREILKAKGYNIVASDFMAYNDYKYDRIIMNPPFSNRMDAEHVQHAYELLKNGGRIVAIMGEGVFFGSDKKAVEFREWVDNLNAVIEPLEEGTFKDRTLSATTGANARLVVIDKLISKSIDPEKETIDGITITRTSNEGKTNIRMQYIQGDETIIGGIIFPSVMYPNYVSNKEAIEIFKEKYLNKPNPIEQQLGLQVEEEHRETLEKVASGELTVDEAIESTVEDHLSENENYYTELEASGIDEQPISKITTFASEDYIQNLDKMMLTDTHKIYQGQKITFIPKNLHFTVESWEDVNLKVRKKPLFRDEEPKFGTWQWDDVVSMFNSGDLTIEGFAPEEKAQLNTVVRNLIHGLQMEKVRGENELTRKELEEKNARLQQIEQEKADREAEKERQRLAQEQELQNARNRELELATAQAEARKRRIRIINLK